MPTPYAAFLCPFCDRSYTCWGYRRRHIKAVHGNIKEVSCRWCPNVYFTEELWMKHIVTEHNLLQADALQGIEILDEAKKVLNLRYEKPSVIVEKLRKQSQEKNT